LPNDDFFKEVIELLNQKKQVSLMVKGTSMKPFLNEDTEVFLKQEDNYFKGDICLFKFNDKYLLHRLTKVVGNDYIFRGDNSIRSETVEIGSIYGKVIYYLRKDQNYKPWSIQVRIRLLIHRIHLKVGILGRIIFRRKK
jgi:SOS-response transcriptional repressor LexA